MHLRVSLDLDMEQIRKVAEVLRSLNITPDNFTDPRFYPSPTDDEEHVLGYFFAMVAIDHRTHYPRPYVLKIGEEEYRGADLLWRLGKELYDRDPEFFTARRLSELDEETVRKWLCPDGVQLWDINIRTFLLRDLGYKVLTFYEGAFIKIVKKSNKRLYNNGEGFVERLKIFRAFEDPVEKKAFLLVKFLYRRRLLQIEDIENLEVPVDNHLVRIAYRLGIVKINEELLKLIKNHVELPLDLDIEIRKTVRKAWKLISKNANMDPTVLDDFLWSHGRRTCTQQEPKCHTCPLRNICKAHMEGEYITEHVHTLTWYY